MTDCRNDCVAAPAFPRPADNPPSLERIRYRIGEYAEIREALLGWLDRDPVLRGWSHREPDDPGIALLEGAAVLGDILTFYQERYANEAFLRTARWRESVADLVRLTGYRLAPGVGGRAFLAFDVEGDRPVTIPPGFPVQAPLEGDDPPAELETDAEHVARPALSRFHLRRQPAPHPNTLGAGVDRLRVVAVDGDASAAAVQAHGIRPGDRLILLQSEIQGDSEELGPSGAPPVVVDALSGEAGDDGIELRLRQPLAEQATAPQAGLRVGRTFRHFGHNAPGTITTFSTSGDDVVVNEGATDYDRSLDTDSLPPSGQSAFYPTLGARELPLPGEVGDVPPGTLIVWEAQTLSSGVWTSHVGIRTVTGVRTQSLQWGHLTGVATVLELDREFTEEPLTADIRRFTIHEVVGRAVSLEPPPVYDDDTFAGGVLAFHGRRADAAALRGRWLLLEHRHGATARVRAMAAPDAPGDDAEGRATGSWPVQLDRMPEPFAPADFDAADPAVTVFGNVVEASQGRSHERAVLGSGDARRAFQQFEIPGRPLTYLREAARTPPLSPALEVWVEDQLWERVESFLGHGPTDQVYVVREDGDGASWVQFGDGRTGRRLPSGRDNVVARYRTGTGARGALDEGASVQPGAPVKELAAVEMPGGVTGGADPESGDKAREAAPVRVQALDRLVSLQDYEVEALGIPGVERARARWTIADGAPAIGLTVLMGSGRHTDFGEVARAVRTASRFRGTGRYPIRVEPARRIYVRLSLSVALQPSAYQPAVLEAVREALGVTGQGGLFGNARRLGAPEYATRIAAVAQGVDGVRWVEVTGLAVLGPAEDPATLQADTDLVAARMAHCPSDGLLVLEPAYLTLTAASEPAREGGEA